MASLVKDQARALVADVKVRGSAIGVGLAAFWTIHIANVLVFAGHLKAYGIHPLTVDGLWGILFAPFLHGSFSHLINNSIAFVWLGLLTMLRRPRDIVPVTVIGALVAGIGTWVTGGIGTNHIGFSGVIFAYLGFLITRGYFERSIGAILVSAGSLFFFGSMIWGVLPTVPGVSWQGHLFGFLGGVLAARIVGTPKAAPKRKR